MDNKIGEQTIGFNNRPAIFTSSATIGGPMEGEGALGKYFDRVMDDTINRQDSWEKCESTMMEWAIRKAAEKENSNVEKLDCVLAGDLLNQLMSTHFALRGIARPFLGLYGACSTMAEGLVIGSMMIDGGFANKIAAAASSHHDAAERQYRFPTEMGVQRPLTSQWTVTGAGAAILSSGGQGPQVTVGTIGKIVDMGIKDPNSMGAAMAPAAADTLWQHLLDTGRDPFYYDMIFTGDLGTIGKQLVVQLIREKGIDISPVYEDCGCLIYRPDQDTHAGASGCASSAVVLCGYIRRMMITGKWKKILLIGTGSLNSPTSYQQKESIPAIAHAVAIES